MADDSTTKILDDSSSEKLKERSECKDVMTELSYKIGI